MTTHPKSKIVLSKTAPVRDRDLQIKIDLFNALLHSELHGRNNISFLNHQNLKSKFQSTFKDNVHPNRLGSSILAKNIGRHINRVLWETPKHKTRHHQSKRLRNNPFTIYDKGYDTFYRSRPPPFDESQSPWWNGAISYYNFYHPLSDLCDW